MYVIQATVYDKRYKPSHLLWYDPESWILRNFVCHFFCHFWPKMTSNICDGCYWVIKMFAMVRNYENSSWYRNGPFPHSEIDQFDPYDNHVVSSLSFMMHNFWQDGQFLVFEKKNWSFQNGPFRNLATDRILPTDI